MMPSSPNYVRNYKEESKTAKARGEKDAGHNGKDAKDHRLRYQAMKKGMVKKGDGNDVNHVDPTSKGGANTLANANVEKAGLNRSFPRNSDGSIKVNRPTKKEKLKLGMK